MAHDLYLSDLISVTLSFRVSITFPKSLQDSVSRDSSALQKPKYISLIHTIVIFVPDMSVETVAIVI